jgi:hypothetical protein
MPAGGARDTDAFEDRNQLRGITPLAWCDDERERPPAALTGQMNLAGQPATRTTQGLIRTMLNRSAASSRDTRRVSTGARSVLVGAAGGRVHVDHAPVDPAFRISIRLDGPQDPFPRAIRRPPAMPVMHGLPLPEPCWQITPRNTGSLPEENAVDHPAMALPTSSSPHVLRQVRLQPSPLLVRQITPPHTGQNDVIVDWSHDPPDTS